jgi:uncharacterized protein (TIGR02246 family)
MSGFRIATRAGVRLASQATAGAGIACLTLASVALAGMAWAAAPSATDAVAEVRAVAVGIIAADNARDLERVLGYYAADAVLMPPNESPVRGKAAIRPRYEDLFARFAPAIIGRIDDIQVDRDWAVVSGANGGHLEPRAGGEPRLLNDVYVMILRRSAVGEWTIVRLIWHAAEPRKESVERGDTHHD